MKVPDLPVIDRTCWGLLPFLGLASGANVATIYYNQPLLLDMSRTFYVSPGGGGAIAVATQFGYAAGNRSCDFLRQYRWRWRQPLRDTTGVETCVVRTRYARIFRGFRRDSRLGASGCILGGVYSELPRG